MSRLVPAVALWMRRKLSLSTTRHGWQERLGLFLALLAVLTGVFFLSQLDVPFQLIYWALVVTIFGLLLRRGWLKLFGPVLFYDLICLARRTRYFLIRCGYALFLLCVIGWMWFVWSIDHRLDFSRIDQIARFAGSVFEAFVAVQFAIVTLLTPVYTASAIADEKERRTLEFLLATDLRNREIVLSKLLARLLNIGVLILAGLPVLALMQFLGGVDPGLVLASYAATLATVASLAGLGTLFSVLVRRGRDAILLTYLCVFAYFIGWAVQLAIPSDWTSTTLGDVLAWYNAGNILYAINSLGYFSWRSGISLNEVLPEVLRNYLIFHGVLALVCIVWAVRRLRAIALAEAYGNARRMRWRIRLMARPSVSDKPMVWKEVFAEPGVRLHWLGRLIIVLLFLASFIPVIMIFDDYLTSYGYSYGGSRYDMLAEKMNIWGRVVSSMIGCLLLVGVAVRAAGSVGGERDRQTLDTLLTSPLDSDAILHGKWLGAVLSVRRGWWWLAAVYGLTLICGGVNLFGVVLAVMAWFVLAGFVAMLGLEFSTVCRTTMRAIVGTLLTLLLAFGGHWLLWACCFPLMVASRGAGEGLIHVVFFQAFALTPPVTLGKLAFRAQEFEPPGGEYSVEHMVMAIIGVMIWAGLASVLWSAASERLRRLTMRTPVIRPERPRLLPRRVPQVQATKDDVLTVEELRDED